MGDIARPPGAFDQTDVNEPRFYGCDETSPTEPTASAVPSLGVGGMPASMSSTFDSGTEGWTLAGDSQHGTGHGSGAYWLQPEHTAAGGNPGGAVYAVDAGQGKAWFFQAPPKFLGNRSGAYGGTCLLAAVERHSDQCERSG